MVLQAICGFLRDELRVVKALQLTDTLPDRLQGVTARATSAADELTDGSQERQRQLLSTLAHRITVTPDLILIGIKRSALAALLGRSEVGSADGTEELFTLPVAIQLKRRGVEAKLVMLAGSGRPSAPDAKLVALLADAHRWVDDLAQGRAVSVRDLARQNNRDTSEVCRTLPLAFLAPDIVKVVLDGRQPLDLTAHQLKRIGLPLRWEDQRRQLRFSSTIPV